MSDEWSEILAASTRSDSELTTNKTQKARTTVDCAAPSTRDAVGVREKLRVALAVGVPVGELVGVGLGVCDGESPPPASFANVP
jgi:hypothetical protein